MAGGQGEAGVVLVEPHWMADQPLQQRQVGRQGDAIGIGPVQPGEKAALMLPGQRRELVGEGGPGMGEQGRPGRELVGHQIETFIEGVPLAIGLALLEGEVVHRSVTTLGGEGELQRPFVGRRWRRRGQQQGLAAVDPEPVGASTRGPAGELGAAHRAETGLTVEAGATEAAQLVVALGIEAERASGQFLALLTALPEGAHHHAAAAGGQIAAVVTEKGETAVVVDALGTQIGAGSVGAQAGELPAFAGLEQILEGELHSGLGWLQPTHQAHTSLKSLQATLQRRGGGVGRSLLLQSHGLVDHG